MDALKVAANDSVRACFNTTRDVVPLDQTDYTDVAAAVFSLDDVLAGALEVIKRNGFDIPIFFAVEQGGKRALEDYKRVQDVLLQVNGVFRTLQS